MPDKTRNEPLNPNATPEELLDLIRGVEGRLIELKAAENYEEARLTQLREALREARLKQDAHLPRATMSWCSYGNHSNPSEVVIVRRTSASVWVRTPGSGDELRRFSRPSARSSIWREHGRGKLSFGKVLTEVPDADPEAA